MDAGAGLEGREVMPCVGLGLSCSAACCDSEKSKDDEVEKRQNPEGGNLQVDGPRTKG